MPNVNIKITLSTKGNDAGPLYDIYYSEDCETYTLASTNASLPSVGSYVVVPLPDTLNCIKLVNLNARCEDNFVISGSVPPTTTTASPTTTLSPTTSTTTLAGCFEYEYGPAASGCTINWTNCDGSPGSTFVTVGNYYNVPCMREGSGTGCGPWVKGTSCDTPTTTTIAPTTSTTTYGGCIGFTHIASRDSTIYWIDCDGVSRSRATSRFSSYTICTIDGEHSGGAGTWIEDGPCGSPTTTAAPLTTTTTTPSGEATLSWTYAELNGGNGVIDIYVNGSIVVSRSTTSTGTYPVSVGDVIYCEINTTGCSEPNEYANAYCTGIIGDSACDLGVTFLSSLSYTVVSGDIGTTLPLAMYSTCDNGCV